MISTFVTLLLCAIEVKAHGHVQGLTANGKFYEGYSPNFQYMNPKPKVPAWSAGGYGQGGITPDHFNTVDIACHDNPKPGEAYAEVTAGSKVKVHWTKWPDSHHGPILDYIAPCVGECTSAKPLQLKFTKIDQTGLMKPGGPSSYQFATDYLIKNNNTWEVTIPKSLKSGNYVLRNEIIALHTAGTVGGAQNYPQCFNLKVVGGGTASLPAGVPATQFYKPTTPGIVFNIAANLNSYTFPGPEVWKQ
ncbi:glycoside hydrolase family 61 protein [Microthyrium microscopicum]|uniref:Glycoside hydrolase family 61 protein n=1 Tax=Microthyrium microscopicum TaxID=703497 RepID=A0A6A6TYM7_9PEZI|nr:glycoside hydrolase family 61 protein [Microthyrium microscopicum]